MNGLTPSVLSYPPSSEALLPLRGLPQLSDVPTRRYRANLRPAVAISGQTQRSREKRCHKLAGLVRIGIAGLSTPVRISKPASCRRGDYKEGSICSNLDIRTHAYLYRTSQLSDSVTQRIMRIQRIQREPRGGTDNYNWVAEAIYSQYRPLCNMILQP